MNETVANTAVDGGYITNLIKERQPSNLNVNLA